MSIVTPLHSCGEEPRDVSSPGTPLSPSSSIGSDYASSAGSALLAGRSGHKHGSKARPSMRSVLLLVFFPNGLRWVFSNFMVRFFPHGAPWVLVFSPKESPRVFFLSNSRLAFFPKDLVWFFFSRAPLGFPKYYPVNRIGIIGIILLDPSQKRKTRSKVFLTLSGSFHGLGLAPPTKAQNEMLNPSLKLKHICNFSLRASVPPVGAF